MVFLFAGRAGQGGSRFLTGIDALSLMPGSPELRFDQKQDPTAAFFVEAIHLTAVPKQVTKQLKLGN